MNECSMWKTALCCALCPLLGFSGGAALPGLWGGAAPLEIETVLAIPESAPRMLEGGLEIEDSKACYRERLWQLSFDPLLCRYRETKDGFTLTKLVDGSAVSLSVPAAHDGCVADPEAYTREALSRLDSNTGHLLAVSQVRFNDRYIALRGGVYDPEDGLFAVSYTLTDGACSAVVVLSAEKGVGKDFYQKQFSDGGDTGYLESLWRDELDSICLIGQAQNQ